MANEETKNAAARIASELSELGSILPSELERILPFISSKVDFPRFWDKAKEVAELFRSLRLEQSTREKLWGKYQELCDRAKTLQSRERDEKSSESRSNRSLITAIIREARLSGADAKRISDLESARTKLARAMELMKEKFLLRSDREPCWESWKEANQIVARRRETICEDNYINIEKGNLHLIGALLGRGEPHEALKYIKETHAKIKQSDLTSDQRRWLRESLQRLWESASAQIEERKKAKDRKHEEWLKRQEEYRRKHEQWRRGAEAKIDRLNNAIVKNEQFIERQRGHIDRLESQIDSSNNDNFIDRARGWIDDHYAKIREAEDSIRDIEAKIADIRAELDK